MRDQWFPGMVREIFLWKKSNACACMREVATNGLTNLRQRYADPVILGEGGTGIVRRGTCKKTGKVYAIKTMQDVSSDGWEEGCFSVLMAVVFPGTCIATRKVWREDVKAAICTHGE